MTPRFLLHAGLLALIVFTSCSQTEPVDDVASDDFLGLSGGDLVPVEDSPWDETWRAEGVKWQGWTEIHVAPIAVEDVGAATWCSECSLEDAEAKGAELARQFHDKIKAAFLADPQHLLKPVDEVGPKTLVLELAIADVVPSRSWFNARGAAPQGVTNHGSIAIAGTVSDAKGRWFSHFKDREECAADLIAGAHQDWSCHAPVLFDRWAARMVSLAHAAKDGRLDTAKAVPTHSY